MKLRAVGYRVLIRPDPLEKMTNDGIVHVGEDGKVEVKSEFGIIIPVDPDTMRREEHAQMTGVVIDIGPIAFKAYDDAKEWHRWVNVGDRVVFNRYGGTFFKDPENKGKEIVAINDDEIMLKFE